MPLRIGFDMDGVLADMELALIREAERLFGPRVTQPVIPSSGDAPPADTSVVIDGWTGYPLAPEDLPVAAPSARGELQLTSQERSRLWRHICAIENFWETLEETETGIVARLASIVAERRWEPIFLTKRPETAGATPQIQTQRWLVRNGFPLPSVYVVSGSRGLMAAALGLDFVVDDTPENCVDVAADSKARTIAVFRNRDVPLPPVLSRMGIQVVHSTDDCLDVLVAIDSKTVAPPRPTAIERVMRTLGLKEPICV